MFFPRNLLNFLPCPPPGDRPGVRPALGCPRFFDPEFERLQIPSNTRLPPKKRNPRKVLFSCFPGFSTILFRTHRLTIPRDPPAPPVPAHPLIDFPISFILSACLFFPGSLSFYPVEQASEHSVRPNALPVRFFVGFFDFYPLRWFLLTRVFRFFPPVNSGLYLLFFADYFY